jgi:hypothetical protein
MDEVLRNYNDLLIQKRYSQNTQDIYCNYFKDFCMHFSKEELVNITTAQINSYILNLIKSKNISISQQNQRINAIKFPGYPERPSDKNSSDILSPCDKRLCHDGLNTTLNEEPHHERIRNYGRRLPVQ